MPIEIWIGSIWSIAVYDTPDRDDCIKAASKENFKFRPMQTIRDLMLAGF